MVLKEPLGCVCVCVEVGVHMQAVHSFTTGLEGAALWTLT